MFPNRLKGVITQMNCSTVRFNNQSVVKIVAPSLPLRTSGDTQSQAKGCSISAVNGETHSWCKNEKPFYTGNAIGSSACSSGRACGHYTQVSTLNLGLYLENIRNVDMTFRWYGAAALKSAVGSPFVVLP